MLLLSWLNVFTTTVDRESYKAAAVDKGRLLKDGADILAKSVSALCNLSIPRAVFPSACKVAKLKATFKYCKKVVINRAT